MPIPAILPLAPLTLADTARIATPFTADAKYAITYTDTLEHVSFDIVRVPLPAPVEHRYDHFDDALVLWLNSYLPNNYSFGAYLDGVLVGFLLAREERWNNSLWVMEFHVAGAYRGQGIGRQLMQHAAEAAVQADLRVITCETQNTNINAIQVYRALGFRLEGVDVSYYTNTDYPDRGIAVFMKRRLPEKQ
jgi:ribosomal protein S18 acetylase RimI-like enzyme